MKTGSFQLVLVLLLLICKFSTCSSDTLQIDIQMDSVSNSTDVLLIYEKTIFYLNAENTVDTNMRPDLSTEVVAVGLWPLNDWGVTCGNDLKETHCSYSDENSFTFKYLDKTYQSYQMNIPCPFKKDNTYNLDGKYLLVNGLYNTSNSSKAIFALGSTGIMGMAPQSPYYSNLFAHKAFPGDLFIFTFEYKLDRSQEWWNPKQPKAYKNGTMTLNGFIQSDLLSNSKLMNVSIPRTNKYWEVTGVMLSISNKTIKQDLTLCITNRENAILAADPAFEIKKLINQALCKKDSGCEVNSQQDKAPSIVLKIADFEISIDNKDYLFSNPQTQSLDQVVDDVNEWKSRSSCSSASSIAVGRMFFSKYAVVFHYSKTENHKIGFGIRKLSRELTKSEKTLLVGFGLVMVVLVLLVMIVRIVVTRKRNIPAEKERKIDANIEEYSSVKN